MAAVCILMDAEARTYRKMVGHLGVNRGLAMKIGLPRIPSKSTIGRAYGMIPSHTCVRSTRGSSAMSW